MLEYLICFIPGVLVGLAMLKKPFETSWKVLTVTWFATYVALWSMPAIMVKYVPLTGAQRDYMPGGTLLVLGIVGAAIFGAIAVKTMPPKELKTKYSETLSEISGVLFGFLSGTMIVAFLLVVIFSTPVINYVASYVPVEGAGKFSRQVFNWSSAVVDSLSFQSDRSEARAAWLEAFTEILPRPGAPEPAASAQPETPEGTEAAASTGDNRFRNIRDRKEAAEAAAGGELPDSASARQPNYIKRQAGRVTQRNDAHQANLAGNM